MNKSPLLSLFVLALVSSASAYAARPPRPTTAAPLPALGASANDATASGISSGAFMATQLLFALSSQFSGAASISGGPVGCSQGDPKHAQDVCMKAPASIDVAKLVSQTRERAASGQIDDLAGLTRARATVIHGTADKVVQPGAAPKTQEYLAAFLPADQIEMITDLPSAHTFPTLDAGNPCTQESLPWIGKCGFDAAGRIFSSLIGKLSEPRAELAESLVEFSQAEFVDGELTAAQLGASGWAYIPASCRTTPGCRVHLALHGCLQNPSIVGDQFRTKAGYNRWAEANRLIVVYPTAVAGTGNPLGCWDWWGFTGANYLARNGKQIQALSRMVSRLSNLPARSTPLR